MENNLMPELRFSEFSSEWNEQKLGEHFGNKRKKGQISFPILSVSQKLGLVRRDSLKRNIQKDAKIEDNLIVDIDDIVYNMMRMWQGAYGLAKIKGLVSPAYVVLEPKVNTNSKYFTYYFSRHRSLYLFTSYSYGLTLDRLRLYYKDFKNIKLVIPKLPEQTKIASFLTAVDKRINLLQKKKAELEQYKKGVMQQLFSQEVRFKKEDGSNFEEWEEKKLGEIGETFNGLTGKTKVDFGKGKPYIQYMQIFRNSRIDTSNFGLVDVGDDQNQSIAKFGDVFFTTSSETPNEIGMSSVLTEQVGDVYLNSFCFGYRPNSLNDLVPEFSQFFFRSDSVRKGIIKLAQGSTRFNMSKVAFMKLKFFFPKKDEQQKIAKFLSSIDKSIENIAIQIDDSVVFKKGLLQKMFV